MVDILLLTLLSFSIILSIIDLTKKVTNLKLRFITNAVWLLSSFANSTHAIQEDHLISGTIWLALLAFYLSSTHKYLLIAFPGKSNENINSNKTLQI